MFGHTHYKNCAFSLLLILKYRRMIPRLQAVWNDRKCSGFILSYRSLKKNTTCARIKVSKIDWSNYRELSYLMDTALTFLRFWGMFPHTFLIFPTIYFWYTKHNHLIINSYHFTLLFGTQIVTMNSGFDNESTKKVSNIK